MRDHHAQDGHAAGCVEPGNAGPRESVTAWPWPPGTGRSEGERHLLGDWHLANLGHFGTGCEFSADVYKRGS